MKSLYQNKLAAWLPVNRMLVFVLAGLLAFGGTSCSSQKRLAKKHAKEARLAQIEQAKAELFEIINDDGFLALEVKERKLQAVKDMNLDDKEINDLIIRAEEKLARDRVEYLKKQEEEAKRAEEERLERIRLEQEKATKFSPLQNALVGVAAASNLRDANSRISDALKLFASPDVPVLILISEEGVVKDYDRPTTIQKYLELLKDQKRYNNDIESVKYDAAGKVTELELRTRY
ncbi:MAG: hypothetical protein IH597_14120 [Bacteroidales bacterium]|nr:hypothetical protein [Bacteroidales bacterium]